MSKKGLLKSRTHPWFGQRLAESVRLSLVDDSTRDDHSRLNEADNCYYLFEYTSGRNYTFSSTNNLINNLKKKPSSSSQNELYYKNQAIARCATSLRLASNPKWLEAVTLVPVPCSKAIGHPDYDARMEQVCRRIRPGLDVRNIIRQTASTDAAHESEHRVTVEELLSIYEVDEAVCGPNPQQLGIVDDVLTAGTHYRAMHTVLSARFPGIPIVGVFIARRVFPNPFEALDAI